MMNNVFNNQYLAAKHALVDTQVRGKKAEIAVSNFLNNESILYHHRIKERYLDISRADIEVDFKIDEINGYETFISVTHSNPLIPGHSNENKLHQKLAELYLFKLKKPERRIVLVVGGDISKWSPYVLKVFELFFDKVVYVERKNFSQKMSMALKSQLNNKHFWIDEQKLLTKVKLLDQDSRVCSRNLRQEFYSQVILRLAEKAAPQYPNQIQNNILRKMGELGVDSIFWNYIKSGQYEKVWQERNYFNILEAITEIVLESNNVWYKGGLGRSVAVHHSVLHDLGFTTTRFTEDFLLYSDNHKKRVYIQCKSSAGGPTNTSKALPSRAREQIGRSILYRSTINSTNGLVSNRKDYISIYILDGYWNYPKKYPLKYVHILQIAGADYILNGHELVNKNFEVIDNNALTDIIEKLRCLRNPVA